MTTFCCKGCVAPKRYPGCHDRCPEYLKQKAEYQERKAAYDKKKKISFGITAQRSAAVAKAMKGRNGGFRTINSKKGIE